MTTRKSFAEMRMAEFQARADHDRLVRKDRGTVEPTGRWSLGRLIKIHRSPAAV